MFRGNFLQILYRSICILLLQHKNYEILLRNIELCRKACYNCNVKLHQRMRRANRDLQHEKEIMRRRCFA